jgi:hypothetical protein
MRMGGLTILMSVPSPEKGGGVVNKIHIWTNKQCLNISFIRRTQMTIIVIQLLSLCKQLSTHLDQHNYEILCV